jgi:hypothetical protein
MWSLASWSHAEGAGQYTDRSVIGKWKLTAVLDRAEISGLDERQANSLIGKSLIISDDTVAFGARTCTEPDFEAEVVEPTLHLREMAHASPENLR